MSHISRFWIYTGLFLAILRITGTNSSKFYLQIVRCHLGASFLSKCTNSWFREPVTYFHAEDTFWGHLCLWFTLPLNATQPFSIVPHEPYPSLIFSSMKIADDWI
jgi:hypothetical protein